MLFAICLAANALVACVLVDGWHIMSWGARLLVLFVMCALVGCGLFDAHAQWTRRGGR